MKLPDIQFKRAVPDKKSPKMAALPNQLQEIDAAVGLVRGTANTIEKVIDSEARLDATRRVNSAKRDYQENVADITQQYHSDRDLPLEGYGAALKAARTESFGSAGKGASGRVNKLMGGPKDAFDTQMSGQEINSVQQLTESRSVMHLKDISQDGLKAISDGVDINEVTADFGAALDIAPIDAADKQTSFENFIATAADQQIYTWAGDRNIAAMQDFVGSGTFNEMNPADQQKIRDQINNTGQSIISTSMDTSLAEVTLGKWTVEKGINHVEEVIAPFSAMTDDDRITMMKNASNDIFSGHIDGLLAKGQYQVVLDTLNAGATNKQGETIIPGEKVAGWMKSATTGLTAKGSQSLSLVLAEAKGATAQMKDGVPIRSNIVDTLFAAANDPRYSESQRNSATLAYWELSEFKQHMDRIGAVPTLPAGAIDDALIEMQNEQAKLKEGADPQRYIAQRDAMANVVTTLESHKKQRAENPTAYALKYNSDVRGSWDTFKQTWAAFDGSDEALIAAQVSYADYSARAHAAQTDYGIPLKGRGILPEDDGTAALLVSRLTEGSAFEQRNAIASLASIMGTAGVSDAINLVIDKNPDVGIAMAFGTLPNNAGARDQDTMLNGIAISKQQAGAIPTMGEFRDSLAQNKVLLPLKALGELGPAATSAVYTYALGAATTAELASGAFTEDTLTNARDAVVGEPFLINPNADYTVPYRKADGSMATAREVKGMFDAMRIDPNYGRDTFGEAYTTGFDGDPVRVDYNTILEYATPIMVENGVYQMAIPASSIIAGTGALMSIDPDTQQLVPKLFNLIDAPPLSAQALNRLRVTTGFKLEGTP